MTKRAKVELLVPSQNGQPGELMGAPEDLLVFDARMLGRKDRRELQRLIPGLLQAGRYWTARFAEKGCLACHRKNVPYASGGLCDRCHSRERHGMLKWYSKRHADRNVEGETSALARRFDAAQALFR